MNAMIQSNGSFQTIWNLRMTKILMRRDRSLSAFSRDVTAPAAAAATAAATAACIALREHSSGS